jgi:hypothetical protein
VDVSLDACRCAAEMELCVAVVAVVRLGCEPVVNVVAIANQKSAHVGSVLLNPIPTVSFVKNPVPWMLISDRLSCATAVMDIIARIPTIIVVRFIEHFDSMRPLLICDLMSATPASHIWQYLHWLARIIHEN